MSVATAHFPSRSAVAGFVTEQRLALASIGLVGLHVVDDNFLQPEPGMSPVDHLPGGLGLLALVAAGAWAYPRVRAGARAAIALLAGFLGVLAGTEAVYYTIAASPSGDDFTGFLSVVAGFVLLGVGVATLWRARRTNDSRRRRYARRGLETLGAVATAFLILVPMAISYAVTHTARAGVPTPNLGATPENVSFTTSDGLRLEGWFVPSRNGATVIAFPGRSGPQKHARMLVSHDRLVAVELDRADRAHRLHQVGFLVGAGDDLLLGAPPQGRIEELVDERDRARSVATTIAVRPGLISAITTSVVTSKAESIRTLTMPLASSSWIGWIEPIRDSRSPTWRRSK